MIREVTGDILLSKANAIVHGVAPNDHFEQGLALGLRKNWPAMVKDFRHYCHTQNPAPGGAWIWSGSSGQRIVSLLTQESGGKEHGRPGPAHTEHVNQALKELRKMIIDEKLTSVALPRLATGVGGLTWEQVAPLIEKHLGDLKIPVLVYRTYKPGEAAEEQLN